MAISAEGVLTSESGRSLEASGARSRSDPRPQLVALGNDTCSLERVIVALATLSLYGSAARRSSIPSRAPTPSSSAHPLHLAVADLVHPPRDLVLRVRVHERVLAQKRHVLGDALARVLELLQRDLVDERVRRGLGARLERLLDD